MRFNLFWFDHIIKVYRLFTLKKLYLLYLFLLISIVSIFELFGISLFVPLVTSLIDGENSFQTSNKIEFLSKLELYDKDIFTISIFIILIFSIKIILGLVCEAAILFLSLKSRALLRSKMLSIYLNMNYIDLAKNNSSELINSIQSFTGQHRGTVLNVLKLCNEVLFLLFAIIMIFLVYGSISIFMVLITTILIFLFDKFTKIFFYKAGLEVNKINSKIVKILSESLYGIKEVKIYKISEYYFNTLKKISLNQSKIETKYELLGKLPRVLFEYIIILAFVFFIIFLNKQNLSFLNIAPDITLIFFLALRLIPITGNISGNIKTIRNNINAINELYDKYFQYFDGDLTHQTNKNLFKNNFQSIELKNVYFQYSKTSDFILENISLKVNKGDIVGIIGASGSGKTTLIDLLIGIMKPTVGEIIYNNSLISYKDYTSSNFAAYLPQNNFIIDDTIEKNIALDYYKHGIDYEKLYHVLKKTNLLKFFESLPEKTKTILGEHGRFLSGGQKQRVAIARALYFNKNLIIMDESTNAMDHNLEKTIINELTKSNDELSLIIITHNEDNLKYCNKVFRVEEKKLKNIK